MTITATRDDGVATLTLDDGKVNAMDLAFFEELGAALDGVADARAVVIAGRDGMFSAGLNTKTLAALDDGGLQRLLVAFGRTMLRVWLEPCPVVAAATGHAVGGGALLAMAADHAVAAAGDDFRWGLPETTIGFPLPEWVIVLARGNMRADRLDDLLLPGALISPPEAVEAGFADALAPPGEVLPAACARAAELAALPALAYAETKRRLREPAARVALERMDAEVAELVAVRR